MKEKLTCKPITYSHVQKIKYLVKTNYSSSAFDNLTEYERFVSHLRFMKTNFKVTIKTIHLLYSNNTLVCRQCFNEYRCYRFDGDNNIL